jgi:hypothetical protein
VRCFLCGTVWILKCYLDELRASRSQKVLTLNKRCLFNFSSTVVLCSMASNHSGQCKRMYVRTCCLSQAMSVPVAPCRRRMSISQGVLRPFQPSSAPPPPPPFHMCGIQYAISRRHTDARPIHFYANSVAHKTHTTASPQQTYTKQWTCFIEGNVTPACVFEVQHISRKKCLWLCFETSFVI